MVMYGADTNQLRSMALAMDNAGASFDHMSATLHSLVVNARWDGPDGIQFLTEWNRSHRTRLRFVADQLRQNSDRLRANAAAQDETSNTDRSPRSMIDAWIRGGRGWGDSGLPHWLPHLPGLLPRGRLPGGWLPWVPRLPGILPDFLLPQLPWRGFPGFPGLPALPWKPPFQWSEIPDMPPYGKLIRIGDRLIDVLAPDLADRIDLVGTAQEGWIAAINGDTGPALRSVLELGKSLPGLGDYASLLDTGWTGMDAALRGDSGTAIHSTLDLARSIPGLADYASVIDTGWSGIDAALNGNNDTAVRSIIDLAWTGVGSRIPQVAMAKGAWDLGWEVGQQIYGVGEVLGINDAVQDTIINDAIQREYGGQVPNDFGKRYDGVGGFANFVGDSGKSLVGKFNPFD